MKAFAELYTQLDETNKTNEKVEALVRYFNAAPAEDAAWVVYFLIGRSPRRAINARKLAEWAAEESRIPMWLFGESYDAVGDMAETITLLIDETDAASDTPLHVWVEDRLLTLPSTDEPTQKAAVLQTWRELDRQQRFIWNKLITGGFRVGVSLKLVVRALSEVSGLDTQTVTHRLMGVWQPSADFYRQLLSQDAEDADLSRPYPFCLAYPYEGDLSQLGDIADWQIEWKWDGIRGQIVRREGETHLWSRGEELVTDRYPEVTEAASGLPDGTVLDGELLAWNEEGVMPFGALQRRIGRKTLGKKMLADVPVVFLTYDLLELNGQDVRQQTMAWRREQLERIVSGLNTPRIPLSPLTGASSWDELKRLAEEARDRRVEGFMLKKLDSPYHVGRQHGGWWKWKVDPYTIDAVLIYAQRGSGKRASLYTDYTFGVWDDGGELVPFAKAYSGLTDVEIREVDRFVRDHTKEQFGPVRTVTPELVFELAFEGIQASTRHKSGIAVRFPRILRWRKDKPIQEADSLATIRALLPEEA